MPTEATLAEPRVAGDSAAAPKQTSAAPVTTATVAGEPAPEQKGVVKDRASRVLKSLSPQELRDWRVTGELPEGKEIELEREFSLGENERLLKEMTAAERKNWRETGEIADRLLNPQEEKSAAAKAEPGSDKELTELAESTVSPIVRVHSQMFVDKDGALKVRGNENEVSALIADARGKYEDRLKADRDSYSIADRTQTLEAWKKLEPQLPSHLVGYLGETVNKLLHKPWTFFRAFSTDAAFRQKVLTALAGKDGSADRMLRLIARFDAGNAPKPRPKVSNAPAPATDVSGKSIAATDEVSAALSAGDFKRFRAAENRNDYLRRTGRSA